jgi:hypothetical protein
LDQDFKAPGEEKIVIVKEQQKIRADGAKAMIYVLGLPGAIGTMQVPDGVGDRGGDFLHQLANLWIPTIVADQNFRRGMGLFQDGGKRFLDEIRATVRGDANGNRGIAVGSIVWRRHYDFVILGWTW